MKCEVIQDLLQLYVDDLCSEESCKLVEEHLEGCSECKKSLNALKEKELFVDEYELEADSSVEKRLLKNIKKRLLIIELVCLSIGAFGGLYTTVFIDQFKLIIIYPFIGCIGYLIIKRFFVTPLLIFSVTIVGSLIMGRLDSSIMLTLVNTFLTVVGGIIGYLIKKIFEKEKVI